MPLAILIIPSIICALYGLYRGLTYDDEYDGSKRKQKGGRSWR